jgi:hypothetical protein
LRHGRAQYAGVAKAKELAESRGKLSPAQQTEQVQNRIGSVLDQYGEQIAPAVFRNPALKAQLIAKYVANASQYAVIGENGQPDVNWNALEADIKTYAAVADMLAPSVNAPKPAATTPASKTAAALNAAAQKPAPTPAKSVATPQARDRERKFSRLHPDAPKDPNERAIWVKERYAKGLPIEA